MFIKKVLYLVQRLLEVLLVFVIREETIRDTDVESRVAFTDVGGRRFEADAVHADDNGESEGRFRAQVLAVSVKVEAEAAVGFGTVGADFAWLVVGRGWEAEDGVQVSTHAFEARHAV